MWRKTVQRNLSIQFLSVVLSLAFGGDLYAQDLFAPFTSPAAKMGGQIFGQAVGVTSIVFGDRPEGKPEVILFSGLLEINKSPLISLKGQRNIAVLFDSVTPSGVVLSRSAATSLGFVKVAVDPSKQFQSVGILREVPSDHGHEAADGTANLFLVFEPGLGFRGPDFGQLRNSEPVVLQGHIHKIPPITKPLRLSRTMSPDELIRMMEELGDADKWTGANDHPIALIDTNGKTQAWFTPYVHVTTLTGFCDDKVDNDVDGRIDEENGDNGDDDSDGFVDEDSKCPR